MPNYVGPFTRSSSVFAPRYRQASLYTRFTIRDDARDARAFAYEDIARAFDAWLERYDRGGPLVIAGVEQGGELAARLLRERIAPDANLRRRLAAAYLIDTAVPAAEHEAGDAVPACARADAVGCVVAFAQVEASDDKSGRERPKRVLVWNDRGGLEQLFDGDLLCVNPVLGAATTEAANAAHHLGGANATGLEWGARPAFLSRQTATQCVNGLLRYTRPASDAFKPEGSWADRQKVLPYNLFYADIEADVERRIAAWRVVNPTTAAPPSSRTALQEPGSPGPAR